MEQPASELNYWRRYYATYPFPQDRFDEGIARVCQTIANMSGRSLKDGYLRDMVDFMPDYLHENSPFNELTLEQQRENALAFKERWESLQKH